MGVSLDAESKADLDQLAQAADKAAGGVRPSGFGKGFRSAVIRYCITHTRPFLMRELRERGIEVLL